MVNERMIGTVMRIMLLSLQIMTGLVHQFRLIRIRRWWVRPHLREALRQLFGALYTLVDYFHINDHEEFYDFVGMPVEHFEILLDLVRVRLTRHGPRRAHLPELKLAAVLNFLAHKSEASQTALINRIGRSTMYKIIPEVCGAIVASLMNEYVRLPATFDEWMIVMDGFYEKFQLPHCLGALDGKHIRIKCPANSGAVFWNFKRFYSVVLMAICDSERRFLYASVGNPGGLNDTTVFRRCSLGIELRNNLIPIFNTLLALPNTCETLTPFLIADGGFALERYVMKPFQINNNMPAERTIYNRRIGKPRKVIEHAFGVLTRKFRILNGPMDFNLDTINSVVMACVCLHNFLISQDQENIRPRHRYGADESSDEEETSESSDDGTSSSESEYHDATSDEEDAMSTDGSYQSLSSESEPEINDGNVHEEYESDDDEMSIASASEPSHDGHASDDSDSSDNSFYDEDHDVDANVKRDALAQYFVSPDGEVDWQYN